MIHEQALMQLITITYQIFTHVHVYICFFITTSQRNIMFLISNDLSQNNLGCIILSICGHHRG